MLQTAVSAIDTVSKVAPTKGVEVAHVAAPDSVTQTAQPQGADAADFRADAAGATDGADTRTNIVEFQNPDVVTPNPIGQDFTDRLNAISQQLQPQTAVPLESRPVAAGATGAPQDDMAKRVKSAVGDMKETYSYVVTTSFVSHIGSQFMQVFNTLLKGQ